MKSRSERLANVVPPPQTGMFVDLCLYDNPHYPYQFFVGGRRCGKTYSALRGAITGQIKQMLYLRRTLDQFKLICDTKQGIEGANPYQPLNKDFNWNYGFKQINGKLAGLYARELEYDEKTKCEKLVHIGQPMGFAAALGGVKNVRGISLPDTTHIIYDEFIPEEHERSMRGEYRAMLNAYMTINSNREIMGQEPLRLWGISNAEEIANPIFIGLGVVNLVERMVAKGKRDIYLPDRGLAIHMLKNSDSFQSAIEKTAVAKLTKGTDFYETAIENNWGYQDFSLVGYKSVKGMRCICALGDAYIYEQINGSKFYVSYCGVPNARRYNPEIKHDMLRFRQEWVGYLENNYVRGNLDFESYELKHLFMEIFYNPATF